MLLNHHYTILQFDVLKILVVENIVRKGDIACNKQCLLFAKCFLSYMVLIFHSTCTLKCCLQFVSVWTSLNFCYLVMGLTLGFAIQSVENKVEIGENPFLLPAFSFPHGSKKKCLTHNPGVLDSSRTGSSVFFRGSVHGQDTSDPSLVLVKPRKA